MYDIILLGDLNVDFLGNGLKHASSRLLRNFAISSSLTQVIKAPTRITSTSRTMLDLIFVNNEHRIIDSGVIPVSISDHFLVYCTLKTGVRKGLPKVIEYRSYKHSNEGIFLNNLEYVPRHVVENETNVEDAVLMWNKLFSGIANIHASIKKKRISGQKMPWLSPKIRESMCDRDYRHRKAMKSNSDYHWNMYKKLGNLVNREMKSAKSKYFVDLISNNKGDDSLIWKALKEATCRNKKCSTVSTLISDGITYNKPNVISEVLNSYFTSVATSLASKLSHVPFSDQKPLYYNCSKFELQKLNVDFVYNQLRCIKRNKAIGLDNISGRLVNFSARLIAPSVTSLLNRSMETRTFPKIWKCAKVTALYKSGNRNKASNYRQISVLPTLSKVLEKAVHTQFYQHLLDNNLITSVQHCFRSRRSTTSALIKFSDDILSSMENGKLCGVVSLDLSKAFDTVEHEILLKNLRWVGVSDVDLQWFASYLKDRTQKTSCANFMAELYRLGLAFHREAY